MRILNIISFLLFIQISWAQKQVNTPECPIVPNSRLMKGVELRDNYKWLEDIDNTATQNYLDQENQYAKTIGKPLRKLQRKLLKEMNRRIGFDDTVLEDKIRDYYYFERTDKKRDPFLTVYRRSASKETVEELVLDINALYAETFFFSFDEYVISPDDKKVAYYLDMDGSADWNVYFTDIESAERLDDELKGVGSMAWANDGKTVFYSQLDSITKRSTTVYKHLLGTKSSEDQLLYTEKDSLYQVFVEKSKSEDYIFISVASTNQSEYYYLNAHQPNDSLRCISRRSPGHMYYAFHFEDKFLLLSNKDNLNYGIYTVPISQPDLSKATTLIAPQKDRLILDIELYDQHMVLLENYKSIHQIKVLDQLSQKEWYLNMDSLKAVDACASISLIHGSDFKSQRLKFTYTGLNTPMLIYDYDMNKKEFNLLQEEPMSKHFSPVTYTSKRIWAKAKDGSLIPVSLHYRSDLALDGSHPLILEGYGAYGISDPLFLDPMRLNLLDRGFVYAYAHVRGGDEMGMEWYQAGKLLNKKNSFTDLIDIAEQLIAKGYTAKGQIVAKGYSAGGLLVGAAMNMRPDLFKLVILMHPFLDVMNTMLNDQLPLTTGEYEEWGNPNDSIYFHYMLSYSPYDNIIAQDYPNILIYGGLRDQQVYYWEQAKMAAKLRALKTDDNTLMLKIAADAGHNGFASILDDYLEDAFKQAYILSLFGIKR